MSTNQYAAREGLTPGGAVDPAVLHAALDEQYLTQTPDTLRATPEGRLRLEALLGALVL